MFGQSAKPMEFLADWQVPDALMRVITRAKRRLTLVSPYNKHWGHLKREIAAAVQRGVQVTLYHRSDEPNPLADFDTVTSVPVLMLHSKIYANESSVLVTTMNLHETSATYSREVGFLIRKRGLRRQIETYVESLGGDANPAPTYIEPLGGDAKPAPMTGDANYATNLQENARPAVVASPKDIVDFLDNAGFCIECREGKKLEPVRPLCLRCFERYGRNGMHKHCHKCGDLFDSQVAQPFCLTCANARLSARAPRAASD
jgi:hypothetical protein